MKPVHLLLLLVIAILGQMLLGSTVSLDGWVPYSQNLTGHRRWFCGVSSCVFGMLRVSTAVGRSRQGDMLVGLRL